MGRQGRPRYRLHHGAAVTSRDYFSQVSEAARQLERLSDSIERRRAESFFHGRTGETIGHGVVLDPMRNVDDFLDSVAADEEAVRQLESELNEAWDVVGGIVELSSDEAAQVVCRHYLWLEPWAEIARALDHTETECQALTEITLDWCDRIGIARLREIGAGKSDEEIAPEISTRNRTVNRDGESGREIAGRNRVGNREEKSDGEIAGATVAE